MSQESNNAVEPDESRIAREYWLQTIMPYVEGRKLAGPELFLATHAHRQLSEADAERFPSPTPLYAEDVDVQLVATLAAPMLPKVETPLEAIRAARRLLETAKEYVEMLPSKRTDQLFDTLGEKWVGVSQIQESNKRGSGMVPLLPPLQSKEKGVPTEERTGVQSVEAIRKAIKRHLRQEAENWEKQREASPNRARAKQQDIDQQLAYLENDWVRAETLSNLRWKRFYLHSQKQRETARSKHHDAV